MGRRRVIRQLPCQHVLDIELVVSRALAVVANDSTTVTDDTRMCCCQLSVRHLHSLDDVAVTQLIGVQLPSSSDMVKATTMLSEIRTSHRPLFLRHFLTTTTSYKRVVTAAARASTRAARRGSSSDARVEDNVQGAHLRK